jgi:hypothetical protein
VWVAHAGLDHLFTVADVWRELPLDRSVRMRWWRVPAGEVPHGFDAQVHGSTPGGNGSTPGSTRARADPLIRYRGTAGGALLEERDADLAADLVDHRSVATESGSGRSGVPVSPAAIRRAASRRHEQPSCPIAGSV